MIFDTYFKTILMSLNICITVCRMYRNFNNFSLSVNQRDLYLPDEIKIPKELSSLSKCESEVTDQLRNQVCC